MADVKTPPPHTATMQGNEGLLNDPVILGVNTTNNNPAGAPPTQPVQAAPPADPPVLETPPAPPPPTPPAAKSLKEMTDEELEEYEKEIERRGKKRALTPDQIAEAKKKEEEEAFQWALQSKKIDKEKYDKALTEKNKTKRDIALQVFAAEERLEDPNLKDGEIEEKFKDFYREDITDEKNPIRKAALRAMNKVAESYLSQYEDVDTGKLVENYRNFNDMHGKYKAYGKQVNEVVAALPKELEITLPYQAANAATPTDTVFKVQVDDKLYEAIRKEFVHENMWLALGADSKEVKTEDLHEKIMYHVKARSFDAAMKNVTKQVQEKTDREINLLYKNSRSPLQPAGNQPPYVRDASKPPPPHIITMNANNGGI